mgnify:CR=1 FL=1
MTYKIYTKQGDKGKTSIIGQNRVDKHDVRIEAYGSVDELNSYFGLLRSIDEVKDIKFLYNFLIKSQNNLFNIGSYLAQTKEKREKNQEFLVLNDTILDLENIIDKIEKEIPPITRFVLPGGTISSSHFQIARAICRRTERRITFFHKKEQLDHNLLIYINRLSDFLFVSARFLIFNSNENELFWEK